MNTLIKPIFTICFVLCWLGSGCNPAKLTVEHVKDASTSVTRAKGGMYYALPMTMLTIEIPVTRITHEPAPKDERDREVIGERVASGLVDTYVNMANDTEKVSYKVDDENIRISARAVPDISKVYHVSLKGNWNKKQDLTIALNELGQFTQGEIIQEDHTFDIITQGVQSAAGIASTLIFPKSADDASAEMVAFSKKSLTEKRKDNLLAIRAARKVLITSDSNFGAEGILNRKLAELDKLEDLLVSQLSFKETKKNVILRADILIPEAAQLNTDVALLSFHKTKGITLHLTPTDGTYQNEHLHHYCSFRTTPDASEAEKIYYLRFNYTTGKQVADVISPASTSGDKGLAYNVPVWIRSAVYSVKTKDGKIPQDSPKMTVAVATVPAPQLGQVAFMPEKTSKTGLELDPLTGALRKASVSQTGLTADQVKNAGTALNSTAGLFQNEKPKTPLEELQNETTTLEQRIKKLKFEMQLDSLERAKSRAAVASDNE